MSYYYSGSKDSQYSIIKAKEEKLSPTLVECKDFYSSNPKYEKLKHIFHPI